jgi:hypothetical protein
MTADVHPAALEEDASRDPADNVVRLENHGLATALSELERRCQSRRSRADDHGL